jgi:hypothetical protein
MKGIEQFKFFKHNSSIYQYVKEGTFILNMILFFLEQVWQ